MRTYSPNALADLHLTIVTLATGCVADEPRLRKLLRKIRETGARVSRIFPSVGILTMESSPEQTEVVRSLEDVTELDFRPVAAKTA
jgi:hypothetical protein